MATILTKKKDTTGAPVAGDLTNSTGGAELAVNTADKRLYTKDSGGNVVEVGTNPGTAVTFTAGTVSAPAITTTGDTNTGVFFPAADTIAFAEGGTESMRLNSSGQVVTTAGTVSLPAITTTGDTNTGIFFPAADTIAFSEGGAEAMRIDSSGNVGIGTISPSYRLDVSKTTAGDVARFTNAAASNKSLFVYTDAQYAAIATGTSASGNGIAFDATNNSILFTTASQNRAIIDSSGNVGIGTSSPTRLLQINGSSGVPLVNFNGYDVLSWDNSVQLNFGGITASQWTALKFYTGGTERMRIDSSGRVGIGVTPSAWAGAGKIIEFGNGPASIGTQNSGDANFMHNAYESPAGTWKFADTGPAAALRYQLDINNGAHKWYQSSANGTAGNNITWTQILAVERAKTLALQGATSQSGTGITFPATQSASTDANTLDDYEEGTWTPTDASGAGLTFTAAGGSYTKIGRAVYWQAVVDYPVTASGLDSLIGSLPFTIAGGPSNVGRSGSFITLTNETTLVQTLQVDATTTVRLYKTNFVRNTNSELSGDTVYFAGFYVV